MLKKVGAGNFPGGPVVGTSPFSSGGAGLIPGQGTKITCFSAKGLKHKIIIIKI